MNTDLLKRFYLVCGLILFVGGCFFLIILTITIQKNPLNIEGVLGSISIFAFVALIFYMSINLFIKYGMARGIDYAIEQQKPLTMKDVDKKIDEIVKTSDKKQMCNS